MDRRKSFGMNELRRIGEFVTTEVVIVKPVPKGVRRR